MRQDVEGLEHEADRVAAKRGPPSLVQPRQIGSGHHDLPRIRGVEPRDDVEQGRLSRARFTTDRHMLARFERQSESVEEPASAGEHLGERGQSENGLTHRHQNRALARSNKAGIVNLTGSVCLIRAFDLVQIVHVQ